MKEYIKERACMLGRYIRDNRSTVRSTAGVFHISKSTVHKDVTERLILIDKKLYKEVFTVLSNNKSLRHIRGGMATKEKYRKLREERKIKNF